MGGVALRDAAPHSAGASESWAPLRLGGQQVSQALGQLWVNGRAKT